MVMRSAPVSEDRTAAAQCGAWHPGLESELPRELLPLATVFRGDNVTTSLAEALELSDYCGLPPQDLVAFRPERLIIHELLVRVTAGVAVPDRAHCQAARPGPWSLFSPSGPYRATGWCACPPASLSPTGPTTRPSAGTFASHRLP